MLRLASLCLACLIAASLLFLPAARGRELTAAGHALLSPLLLMVCALFVHGVGMRPGRGIAHWLLAPWLLWPATLLMAALWWLKS